MSIIQFGENGLGQVLADLGNINVNAEGEFDVMDMVASQVNVHQTWNAGVIGRIFVVMHTLDERGGAVPHTDDRHTYFFFLMDGNLLFR